MTEPFIINQLPGRTIAHAGRDYLFFSGTAYLGIQQHPAFQQLLTEGICRYGAAFGSSRIGNLRLSIYEEAETKLAAATGAETALTLSSGMMAGQVVVNYLREQNAYFVYGPHAHPALWHEPSVRLPDCSFAEWTSQLPGLLAEAPNRPIVVLTNSLDAVRSEYYDFAWVDDLPDDRLITVVVDDSHGLGVLNHRRGIWPQISQKPNVRLIVTASLAKAIGLPGGVVLGDERTLADLRRTAFFGACSPMPPAYLDAFVRADALYAEGYDRLQENLKLAEKLLTLTGLFSHATGYPVFYTQHDDLYPFLIEKGIFAYSFAYPTAADRANTRLVISAFHSFDDIQALANAVYAYSF